MFIIQTFLTKFLIVIVVIVMKYEGIMMELSKALEMGDYGVYVWPSFAVAAFIISIMLVVTLRSLRQTQKILNDLQEYQEQK